MGQISKMGVLLVQLEQVGVVRVSVTAPHHRLGDLLGQMDGVVPIIAVNGIVADVGVFDVSERSELLQELFNHGVVHDLGGRLPNSDWHPFDEIPKNGNVILKTKENEHYGSISP